MWTEKVALKVFCKYFILFAKTECKNQNHFIPVSLQFVVQFVLPRSSLSVLPSHSFQLITYICMLSFVGILILCVRRQCYVWSREKLRKLSSLRVLIKFVILPTYRLKCSGTLSALVRCRRRCRGVDRFSPTLNALLYVVESVVWCYRAVLLTAAVMLQVRDVILSLCAGK